MLSEIVSRKPGCSTNLFLDQFGDLAPEARTLFQETLDLGSGFVDRRTPTRAWLGCARNFELQQVPQDTRDLRSQFPPV